MSESHQIPEKSFLTQRFAKLAFGQYTVLGYSVAGEESVVQIPELNVCFDIGRAPHFALTSDIICLSHGHMDHLAGLAYYLSQRHFQGMKPGTILLPAELHRGVDNLLKCWRDVERQGTPYTLIPMQPDQVYEVRRDFMIRALATHHGGGSLGYSLVSVREKLKQEYMHIPGPELAVMRRQGVPIQYRLEVPLVTYLGDTTIGTVFEQPDVRNAEILITEITFFEHEHRQRAKVGKHLHIDHFLSIVPNLNNKQIVITHVSRRTGIRKARRMLAKALGEARMANIHFLMDFDQAVAGGDIEDLSPLPPEGAGE
ncbi:MAG TPA: MBL fold metallo-hydrolase [Tepidisphaeraceae bacterium]|nr:MBL fold metallo-hydrolase [Tepidisphaeraceae bacterium]